MQCSCDWTCSLTSPEEDNIIPPLCFWGSGSWEEGSARVELARRQDSPSLGCFIPLTSHSTPEYTDLYSCWIWNIPLNAHWHHYSCSAFWKRRTGLQTLRGLWSLPALFISQCAGFVSSLSLSLALFQNVSCLAVYSLHR